MLPYNRGRLLNLANCIGHDSTPHFLYSSSHINIEVPYFPSNATHLGKDYDFFSIQK